jgi:hypothetical protein
MISAYAELLAAALVPAAYLQEMSIVASDQCKAVFSYNK